MDTGRRLLQLGICRKLEHGVTLDAYDLLRPRLAATELAPMSLGDVTIYY